MEQRLAHHLVPCRSLLCRHREIHLDCMVDVSLCQPALHRIFLSGLTITSILCVDTWAESDLHLYVPFCRTRSQSTDRLCQKSFDRIQNYYCSPSAEPLRYYPLASVGQRSGIDFRVRSVRQLHVISVSHLLIIDSTTVLSVAFRGTHPGHNEEQRVVHDLQHGELITFRLLFRGNSYHKLDH